MFPLLYHLQKASLEVDYYEAVAFCFSYVGGQLSRKIVEDMDPFHGACEIVELRDKLVASQHSKETNRLSGGPIVDDRTEKFSRQKTAGRYTLEDEINKLFEAIEVRDSARGLGPSCQFSKGSSQISASKKPIRGGISQASGIGISESVTLKQALRGLRISHASEVAAMKRVSKSTASSKVAEAVAVKRLYRAVVVEANDSGLTLDESKGSLLQISLVPEESKLNSSEKISSQATREENLGSTVHSSPQFAVPATTEISMIKAQLEEGIGPVPTEVGTQALTLKLGQEGKLKSALSLCCSNISNRTETLSKDTTASKDIESKRAMMKFGKNLKLNFSSSLLNSSASSKVKKSVSNSPRVVNPVPKNNCFPNKKMKKEVSPACSSSNTCIADVDSALSPSASKVVCQAQNSNQNVLKEPACPAFSRTCLDVNVSLSNADYKANKSVQGLDSCNKRNFDAKASECSRSREAADFSQSSKSSLGAYSSTTCISDESNVCGSSCSGSRPHMSKDLRWEAIRRVEMQHGSLDLRHFKLLKRLGCGDLGTVYLAELTGTNCLFAVKIMDNESLGSRKKMPRALTERDILQVLDHPFLPTLFAYFTTNKFSILVMECPGGDLHILRQKQPGSIFTEQAARFYVAEVLLALEYLHMLGIVYRDLKPENILVREDGHIMLSDFDLSLRCTVKPTLVKASLSLPTPPKGISGSCVGCICTDPFCVQPSWVQVPCFTPRHVSTPTNIRKLKSNSMTQVPQLLAEPTNARSHSFVGTHEYLAPEIIRGEGHGNAVDWWTFGIFLYELLFGTTPFKGPGNDDTLVNVVMHTVKFPESSSVSSQAKDLIRGLLRKEPKDRFGSAKGAAEIRKHPFFKGLNWALIRCAVPPTVPKSSETGVSLTTAEENKLVEYKMSSAEHPEFDTF